MSLFTKRKATDWIVVHCSATPEHMDVGVKEIRQWHRQRGFVDIGYHYVIRRDGTVETGRPEDTVGAHVEGYNTASIGVCLVGGVDAKGKAANNFTVAQFTALLEILTRLQEKYNNPKIQGHRDFPGVRKDCPSFDVKTWLATAKDGKPHLKTFTLTNKFYTLWSVAGLHGVTVDALKKANPGIDPANMKVGQVINLP